MASTASTQPSQQEARERHQHDHGHGHGHVHQQWGDNNAEHFDAQVASPETATRPEWARMYDMLSVELVAQRAAMLGLPESPRRVENEGEEEDRRRQQKPSIRMLDYACGGGHASRTLLPYVDTAIGVDVSSKSVDAYNRWAAEHGVDPRRMHALQGNVMTDDGLANLLASEEFKGDSSSDNNEVDQKENNSEEEGLFDLVVCILALHHVQDPPLLVKRLADRLRPGGRVMIIDWNQDGCKILPKHKPNFVGHVIHAHGFSSDTMRKYMADAGCPGFEYKELLAYTESGVVAMSVGTKGGS